MALTDTECRKAQKGDKPYKMADGGGLYLFVTTTGHKSWRFKYRFGGKEGRLVFGTYPEVKLTEARDRRDVARRQLRDNLNPALEKKKAQVAAIADAEETFKSVASRWHALKLAEWSPRYGRLIMFALERDVFPRIGSMPIRSITGRLVLEVLRGIEKRGAFETAHRIRQQISAVFVFAMSEELVETDVAATLAKGLKKVPKAKKFPAITEIDALRTFVRDFEEMRNVGAVVRHASRLLALTAVRPGVIASAPWAEFEDIDFAGTFIGPLRPLWRISAERMKLDVDEKGEESFDLVLPLSRQAVDVLRSIRRETYRSPLVFPGARSGARPLSGDAIRMAYRRLGYGDRHVPHGWRAAFSTNMNDRVKRAVKAGEVWRKDDRAYIDLMLGHVPEGMSASELRYNRLEHIDDFRRIAQEWADLLLDGLRPAADLMFTD